MAYHSRISHWLVLWLSLLNLTGCDFFIGHPPDEKVSQYFTSHYERFEELKNMCKTFPNIMEITDDGKAFHLSEKTGAQVIWTDDDMAAKNKMQRLRTVLGLEAVSCSYYPEVEPEIQGARFIVDTWGLSVSGGMSAIDYYENCKPLGNVGVPDVYSITLPLSKPCWFLYRSW
ncbi:hypothetical protein [Thiothrix fructosivorans]|jgi:hypothetical protein|uniref:Uncharacterized protein n=1 Tax=Thiothrix fructosivorans TaxID=111770 RepID=A0A8B0SP73_9GAMM|nr:hypothetical protein [Thiothrix fructosivorans]MBO0612705.1 hypothetical protein [Thiothrix fructosivorans]QTX11828.1 hypothetical protein J1836_005680 [Thiothrix fructosivorans]